MCGFLGCEAGDSGIRVVGVVGCGFLFSYLCGGLVFYMHLLGSSVRRVWGNYLGIGCGKAVHKRVPCLV